MLELELLLYVEDAGKTERILVNAGKIPKGRKPMHVFTVPSRRHTDFTAFLLEAEALFADTEFHTAFTSSLKSLPSLLRICLWYSYIASMHFHVHKEDITNFNKDSVN